MENRYLQRMIALLTILTFWTALSFAQNTQSLHLAHDHLDHQHELHVDGVKSVVPQSNEVIEDFRTRFGRSRSAWEYARVEQPVCQLLASDEIMETFVRPPADFLQQRNARSEDEDCSNIEVTYNFPPELDQATRDQYIFAYEYAVAIWESQLSSPVDIKVQANLVPLDEGVLGSAGPFFIWNFGTEWYGEALADQLVGFDISQTILEVDTPDIVSNFSTAFGWYLGTDGQAPPGTFDFVTVVLHELCHGLGFFGSGAAIPDPVLGVYGQSGLPFIYDLFIEDGSGVPISSFPPSTVLPQLGAYLQSDDLFNVAPSVVAELGGPGKIFAPTSFRGGSSYSHWDETTFLPGDVNSLMTPFLGFQEANHDPGPITLAMFNDHGWTLSENCTGPTPTDLSTGCSITGISFDPDFGGPVCDNPGVFSEEGGAFGPVGSHVVCLRIDGINPFNQPLDASQYEVKIKGKTYDIIDLGYRFFEGEQYFYVCVGGVATTGQKNFQVKVKLAPGCTFTAPRLYDSPDCGLTARKPLLASNTTLNPSYFKSFPNPSSGAFSIQVGDYPTGQLVIRDPMGRVVLSQDVARGQQLDIDLKQASGLYSIQLIDDSGILHTEKIMVVQ